MTRFDMLDMQKEFSVAMGVDHQPPEFWDKLIKEEREELLKEIVDVLYTLAGKANVSDPPPLEMRGIDMALFLQSVYQLFHPDVVGEAFKRVHESNMSKLGDDGKPIYNEDGKVMKGPNYKAPNLEDLV